MEKQLMNLTAHSVNLLLPDDTKIVIWPSGKVARVCEFRTEDTPIAGVPCSTYGLGPIEGLPEPSENVVYITSKLVATEAAKQGRDDVVSPGDVEYDSYNMPIYCKSLLRPAVLDKLKADTFMRLSHEAEYEDGRNDGMTTTPVQRRMLQVTAKATRRGLQKSDLDEFDTVLERAISLTKRLKKFSR